MEQKKAKEENWQRLRENMKKEVKAEIQKDDDEYQIKKRQRKH